MKNGIPSEKYYFLLEWKDSNMEEFIEITGGRRICELTTFELYALYDVIIAHTKQTRTEGLVASIQKFLQEQRESERNNLW